MGQWDLMEQWRNIEIPVDGFEIEKLHQTLGVSTHKNGKLNGPDGILENKKLNKHDQQWIYSNKYMDLGLGLKLISTKNDV